MKVLYALGNYPQLSESYVEAEIEFALKSGIDVEVWSPDRRVGSGKPSKVKVHRGEISSALRASSPCLIHAHYLTFARQFAAPCPVPVTIRAHSFDWSPKLALELASFPSVKAIYAFPHFAREVPNKKIVALPVAYSSVLFPDAAVAKDPFLVARLAAGRRMKGLSDFFAVAGRVPNMNFTLAVATTIEDGDYIEELRGSSGKVSVLHNLPRKEAVDLTRRAAVYLDTSDPAGHPFGMPVSVAEALSSGSLVLMRDSAAAREYGGSAVFYYSTVEEAAGIIRRFAGLGGKARAEISAASTVMASLYKDESVLPRMIVDWRKLCTTPS